MEKYKKLKLSLITLLLALVIALTAAVFAINGKRTAVYAASSDRFVELDGNSVFYTAIHGAEICESEAVTTGEGEEAQSHRYTLFKIGNEQTVSYRQNLAYKWLTASGSEDGEPAPKTFSMELYFPEINFKLFYIKFESQQYTLTKEGKSTNYLVFTADGENSVKIGVSTSIEEEELAKEEVYTEIGTAAKGGHIEISLGGYKGGDYTVNLDGEPTDGKFKNVYEKFASYVASGDNAVTPLTFGAVFEDKNKSDNEAQMALVDINGQSFEMHKDDNTYKIKDTAAPVICFSQTPSYLEYGKTIGFQYKVIDVIATSPRATAYYYVLTGEQYASETFDYDKTDYETKTTDNEGEEEGEETEPEKSPFTKLSSTSTERIYTNAQTFIPNKYLKSDVMGLVKIYYEISDVSSTSQSKTDIVFVDWYVKEETPAALEDIRDIKGSGRHSDFIKLIKSKVGVTYAAEDVEEQENPLDAYKQTIRDFQEAYQAKIDEAIANLKYDEDSGLTNGKLYAGGSKFYLPAIEGVTRDEYFTGTDLKYSLYYRGSTSGSNTSLASNKLAIDLNNADTTYRFTIFITDSFGNPMRYPTKDEAGNVVWEEITTSDVWDEDFAELLPYFEFDVSYKEATAEPPENLSISYVSSSYSGVSFKITGVSSTYTATYKLYVFDRNAYYADTNDGTLDYDKFNENTEKLFDNTYKNGVNTRQYFTTVKPVSQLLESDENYDKFKALNWNASSVSFTPQSVEDFYVVELQLTDNRSQVSTPYYATVASSVQATAIEGEGESWIENNKTSVVLFSVAGVCLIALVVLLVIKPKDKGDIDQIYTEVEGDGKGKKKDKKQ